MRAPPSKMWLSCAECPANAAAVDFQSPWLWHYLSQLVCLGILVDVPSGVRVCTQHFLGQLVKTWED